VGRDDRASVSAVPDRLREIEIVQRIPEAEVALSHVRPKIRTSVGIGIEPLSSEKDIFDKLVIGVEAEQLVVDISVFRPW